MSGARCRRKGNRVERIIAGVLEDHGLAAEQAPLFGAARAQFGKPARRSKSKPANVAGG